MALPTWTPTYPNQANQAGDVNALIIEEFTGIVEHTIKRKQVLAPFIPMRTIRGTNTITNYAVGATGLGKVTSGTEPDKTSGPDISRNFLVVDTHIYARNPIGLLDVFQSTIDIRREIAVEHGETLSKFTDNTFFIQAVKAARATQSSYSLGTAGKPGGFGVGNVETLATSADALDGTKLYKAISNLCVRMEQQDVQPNMDSMVLALIPSAFYALLDAEQIINGNYVTADGTSVSGMVFKAFGVPVVKSNNIPTTQITGHLLSNTQNGNAYDGDFRGVVGVLLSPKALMAGETIPLQSDLFYDKLRKSWFVDSERAFGVAPNRNEYAGVIQYTPGT